MTLAMLNTLPEEHRESLHLGPAEVVEVKGATPIVMVQGRPVRAELALAFPYVAKAGDELLIVGKDGQHYVIGVLRCSGEIALRFVGDVRLHALGGKLELAGDEGVRLRGGTIEILSRKLELISETVTERATNWYRRVHEMMNEHSGEKRELVDGNLSVVADRASTLTRGITTINGKEVHLG